ncbi:MAG: hypothetical protein LAT67_03110 [Balneolales bacterium]|nr:hypothetical protein [Balneolales bacterium]
MFSSIKIDRLNKVIKCSLLLSFFLLFPAIVFGQHYIEPELRPASSPASPLDYDLRNGATFNLNITNYGFSIAGQYNRVIGRNTEWTVQGHFGTLKDSREQTFFFFGQQVIPNKYKRVFNFPVMTGFRQRLFARYIDDNFRVMFTTAAGPVFSFSYPYFDEQVSEDGTPFGVRTNRDRVFDAFQGWGDGSWDIGYAAISALAVDFGTSFSSITSLEFGVLGQYYPDGLQIMEPNLQRVDQQGNPVEIIVGGGFGSQKWFFTPTITLKFGGMW